MLIIFIGVLFCLAFFILYEIDYGKRQAEKLKTSNSSEARALYEVHKSLVKLEICLQHKQQIRYTIIDSLLNQIKNQILDFKSLMSRYSDKDFQRRLQRNKTTLSYIYRSFRNLNFYSIANDRFRQHCNIKIRKILTILDSTIENRV